MVCSNRTPISQQSASASFDQSFISYVCKHEALDTHKACAACKRNRKRTRIGAREYLDAKWERYRPSYFRADDGHRGGDLRTDAAFQVRAIMRVLNHHAVKSRTLVLAALFNGN